LVKPLTKVEVTNSTIYTKESVDETDVQFFEVLQVAESVNAVKVGDIVGVSWREMTPPMLMDIDGVEMKVGITDEEKVQFVVEKDGSISNLLALNEIAGGCEEEAVRVVRNSPDFKPGMQRGRPIRVQMVLPIHFSLNKETVGQDGLPSGKIIVEGVEQRNGELKVDASYADGLWTGTVRDPEGNTLPGAHIIIVDSTIGTVTDVNGDFSIKASSSQNLVVSFVGYQSVRLLGK
jgi:hypothetical protein